MTNTSEIRAQLDRAATQLLADQPAPPQVGVVLGSGLGKWAEFLEQPQSTAYDEIEGMRPSTVPGHSGKLWFGTVAHKRVACLQGRVHAYEGHSVAEVVYGVRLLAKLGCRTVLLTNAAGGIRRDLTPGSLMLITDHINLTGRNPILGWQREAGPFVDMSCAYDLAVRAAACRAAQGLGLTLSEGVYAALLGPTYETPAEVRMLATLGADAVGMSTAVETIALRAEGVAVGAMSCITNCAAGIAPGLLDHEEVQKTASAAAERFQSVLSRWVQAL